MNTTNKIAVLREQVFGLDTLPETVRVPALGANSDETVKPIGSASVDDLAFALIALNIQSMALYREIDAVRTVHDECRKAGALGADIAINALFAAKGGK
jgi:hypothetical protein